jgi:hypothetical protein
MGWATGGAQVSLGWDMEWFLEKPASRDAIHCQHKKIDCPQRKVGGWVWQEMLLVGLILAVE